MKTNSNSSLQTTSNQPPAPPTLGQSMVNIARITTTRPDFQALTKPTQQTNGTRQFRDEKGVFYETDQSKSKKTVISE